MAQLNLIAMVYFNLGNYEKALEQVSRSLGKPSMSSRLPACWTHSFNNNPLKICTIS
ncbi:tetratricopeptide repeat protein [Alteromonas pelagimontana]|uniref:Tetratricopeptide repeat protein n=1 Tax=Alteromonas pelagimontana TaxID=1858656 RepID=A0A6M4MG97_9ALTE|nr:tetratricopeptide repeat protein [Alteromonas pelagimontana]QJR81635.1 tetratricopeptide repeat protein [Alteromonas pelagimontana]